MHLFIQFYNYCNVTDMHQHKIHSCGCARRGARGLPPKTFDLCPNRKQLDWNFHDYLAYQAKLLQYRQKSEYLLCVFQALVCTCV